MEARSCVNACREILPPRGTLADANALLRHPFERGAWIWHPGRGKDETAVLRFTRRFELAEGASPLIHVTGDQRFQLRCDGQDVTFGPDRCDLEHWTVQSVRIDLVPGAHEFEALVWWIAEPRGTSQRVDQEATSDVPKPPMAQMSWRGGFLFFTDDLPSGILNTGEAAWKVADLTSAVRMHQARIPHYFDVGPSFDFDLCLWAGGEAVPAVIVEPALQPNLYGVRRPGWSLYPAMLPEQRRERWTGGRICAVHDSLEERAFSADDEKNLERWQQWLSGAGITIPAKSEKTVLWDLGDYYCGYPQLSFEGGSGGWIEWHSAEALYEEKSTEAVKFSSHKGCRDEIRGKAFLGFGETWRIAGGEVSAVPSLWWRSGRFVRLRIATADEPLTLNTPGLLTSGFPFERGGEWRSSDAGWDALMPIFERAFRCSAHETWTDTPYYEQMCYVGDTMMHALSNYSWFTDDRISRRAVEMFEWSRRPSGLVAERYPSAWRQECVTYAMLWPLMVRDFAFWRDDQEFVKRMLPGIRSLIAELEGLKRENGLIVEAPGWPWVDWVPEWPQGCGPGVREGDSSVLNLHWVLCLNAAAQVEEACGDAVLSGRLRSLARDAVSAILARFWDEKRGLILDSAGVEKASEHAQFFALLTGLLDAEKTKLCLTALRESAGLSRATISAAFYLLDALYQNGDEAEFHRRLAFWRDLPRQGFKSTPEAPEPTRSDAHAWGAHPAWHSLASIAGIRPVAPGFRRVRIAPCPGSLEFLECSVVHPRGVIDAAMQFAGRSVSATVVLPSGISGEFRWRGKTHDLVPGKNTLTL